MKVPTKPGTAGNQKEIEQLPMTLLEFEEIYDDLKQNKGLGPLLDLLLEDTDMFTRKGRINKSKICRTLGMKAKELDKALDIMRTAFAH